MSGIANSKTVLIIEDEPALRRHISELLRAELPGLLVFEVASTEEAEALTERQHLDLVLSAFKGQAIDGTRTIQKRKILRSWNLIVYSDLFDSPKIVDGVYFFPRPADPSPFIKQALALLLAVQKKIRVDIGAFEAFRRATIDYFNKILSVDMGVQRLVLRKDEWLEGEVGIKIPLKSEVFQGQFVLVMDKRCFLETVSHLLKAPVVEVGGGGLNALKEMASQIFEISRAALKQQGYPCQSAAIEDVLVIQGQDCRFKPTEKGHICVSSEFLSPFGPFFVEVQITSWGGRT